MPHQTITRNAQFFKCHGPGVHQCSCMHRQTIGVPLTMKSRNPHMGLGQHFADLFCHSSPAPHTKISAKTHGSFERATSGARRCLPHVPTSSRRAPDHAISRIVSAFRLRHCGHVPPWHGCDTPKFQLQAQFGVDTILVLASARRMHRQAAGGIPTMESQKLHVHLG